MPTYAYACTECHHRFDTHQSFSDAALTECPECAGRLRKVFGAVGVVFKGSGFYRTDSRDSNGKRKAAPSSTTTADSSTSSSSGSADQSTSTSGASTSTPAAPAAAAAP